MLFDTVLKKEEGLYRSRQGRGGYSLNFSANDYLGLARDPRVVSAFQNAFAKAPVGSGGSMVVLGQHPYHKKLEEAFCEALQVEDAVLLSSGYVANLSLMMMAAQAKFKVMFDKAIHASFYDGLKLSDCTYKRFPHQTYPQLTELNSEPTVLLTESVFSMSGYFSKLDKLAVHCVPSKRWLWVDEAHAFGLYGKEGLGSIVHFGLTQEQVPLRVIPLGKAFGVQGAIVAGKAEWVDAYIQSARGYIYSTGMSPAFAAGLIDVLKLLREADEARAKLFENVAYFRSLVADSALSWTDSVTPIQQLKLGCVKKALQLTAFLLKQGIFCQAIRPPTVLMRDAGLRVVLTAKHTKGEIERFVEITESFLK